MKIMIGRKWIEIYVKHDNQNEKLRQWIYDKKNIIVFMTKTTSNEKADSNKHLEHKSNS